ncbi:MAG: AhpC/TSA family protein [Muribaculaceae bacterium]|nr:AhpC/TSA family protein [Muribaculaceae bacterium]
MKHISLIGALGLAALMGACSTDGAKWNINGTINGLTDSDVVVLEGSNQGRWYTIDTIKTDADGKFNYSHVPQGYPDIYRLRTAGKALYFPIDSIESVTITATAPDIATNHTLSGSPQAENLFRVDSLLSASASTMGVDGVVTDENLKRRLGQMLLADPAGIVTYYIISKKVDGKPLFNPSVQLDNRLIGAVANAFAEQRPSDPRTSYLRRLYLENRRNAGNLPSSQLVATEVGAFDIKLYDQKGREHSLLDISKQGKVALLNFTAYGAEWSPAFNIELNKVYEKYRDRGFEIYQVAVDTDEYAWKQTATNLPWITVLNDITDSKNLINYNVTALPVSFVIDRNGEITDRLDGVDGLDSTVASRL